MLRQKPQNIAVIGAGIAGAACARALSLAGHAVNVFDKSRGPGGRLATRRIDWVDAQGQACTTMLDHGAVGITAHSAAFRNFVDQALRAGWLAEWVPTLAANSLPPEGDDRHYLPVPGMPALCRHLLESVAATWSFGVDKLHHGPLGWQVEARGERHDATFDAVALALPPAQAAPVLAPHRSDWARHASVAPMQPCWTLMGVEDAAEDAPDAVAHWDLARPPAGPLACVLRSDARPGRERVPGQALWVVHARAGWSRRHLEQPAAWVQAHLQAALVECLGRPVDWLHCEVHRWRYAMPQAQRVAPAELCWWDAAQGLGVCGDFLGGCGVEGAWLSAQSLSTALLQRAPGALDAPAEIVSEGQARRLAA
jgi:predicted NAD/FAD-dependent oxidoreductase